MGENKILEAIAEFLSGVPAEIYVFLISILPLIELRGAIPAGAILGLPYYTNFIMAVLGNLLPVPFILVFIPKILDFLSRFKLFAPIVRWVHKKADKHKKKVFREEASPCVYVKKESQGQIEESSTNINTSLPQKDNSCLSGESDLSSDIASVVLSSDCDRDKNQGQPFCPRKILKRMPHAIFIGLLLFVALPVPGTGAWTAALVASLFGLPRRSSFLSISLGVLLCGVIMCLASYGVLGFLSFLI